MTEQSVKNLSIPFGMFGTIIAAVAAGVWTVGDIRSDFESELARVEADAQYKIGILRSEMTGVKEDVREIRVSVDRILDILTASPGR